MGPGNLVTEPDAARAPRAGGAQRAAYSEPAGVNSRSKRLSRALRERREFRLYRDRRGPRSPGAVGSARCTEGRPGADLGGKPGEGSRQLRRAELSGSGN